MAPLPPPEGDGWQPPLDSQPPGPSRASERTRRLLYKLRPAMLTLSGLLALYVSLGYQLAPRLLRKQAKSFVMQRFQRELALGAVHVHPLSLTVELRELRFPDADGPLLFGCDYVRVDFELFASLYQRGVVFREITLLRPTVRAVVRADGKVNLTDLSQVEPSTTQAESPGAPLTLAIRQLTVASGALEFVDLARPEPFRQRLSPVSFSLRSFRTSGAGGAFALSAQSQPDARFWWKGSLTLSPRLASSGRFAVVGLPVAELASYLARALPFEVASGSAALSGKYDLRMGQGAQGSVQLSALRLDGLSLYARGRANERVSLASLSAVDAALSLDEARVEIARVRLRGLATNAVFAPDGSLNLAHLWKDGRASEAPAESTPWSVRIHALALSDAALTLEDRAVEPPVKVAVGLDGELRDLTLDPRLAIPFWLEAKLDRRCRLHLSGSATPESGALDLKAKLEGAELATFEPYFRPFADLTVESGRLDATGRLRVQAPAANAAELELSGDVIVHDLRTADRAHHKPLAAISRLALDGVRYRHSPASLEVARIELMKPSLRLVLSATQQLNVLSVLRGEASEPSAGTRAASSNQSVAPVSIEPTDAPMQLRVGVVQVDDMRLSFADHFVQPNFSADLRALRGSVEGLSSAEDAQARIALTGQLGANAPVRVTGKLRPFAYEKSTDLRLTFQNVPLPVFNPYSGRFAGYNIERGDLSSSLRYLLRNGRLRAEHHIRVDQLSWGDATETKREAELPVRLATAMLRDRNGVIALDVPVQGSLADPSFRVGPLVWQAIRNMALRAATAPFEWLGALFQGAEQARFIDFAPGDATLSVADQRELATLARALSERPALRVDVPLGVERLTDRAALVERKLERALKETIREELWGERKSQPYAALDAGDKIDVLEALYEQLTGVEARIPDAPEPPAESSFRARRAARKAFAVRELERMTRAAIPVEPAELDALGLKRAYAIERALLSEGKVEAHRVLVSSAGPARSEQGKVRLELALD